MGSAAAIMLALSGVLAFIFVDGKIQSFGFEWRVFRCQLLSLMALLLCR
jgi:hypothetical protein